MTTDNYWSRTEAALGLGRSLKRIAELEDQKGRYDYSYPPALADEQAALARDVRDAVRYLVSTEADD